MTSQPSFESRNKGTRSSLLGSNGCSPLLSLWHKGWSCCCGLIGVPKTVLNLPIRLEFRAQVESDLINLLAELPDAPSLHTQLLVFRQEWSELQQDLLTKVKQL